MLSRCIFCHADLPVNRTLEHFPVGRRVAFDPARGRLWSVCSICQRWNLAPFEERWEALEELERLTTDRGRLLSQTEHIALLRAEDIDIVRVGQAKLAEEAWWRYGREMQRRHARHKMIQVVEVGAYVGAMMIASGFFMFIGGEPINNLVRWRKFGSVVWRGQRFCARCGRSLHQLKFDRAKHLILSLDDAGNPMLEARCKQCGFNNRDGGFRFTGPEAEQMLRRNLAYYNFAGATERRVKEAVHVIDQAGSPEQLIRQLARQQFSLTKDRKKREGSIALEIAINDETERQWLELELAELEARWREEEELAAIVDGELTELPLLERIRVKLPG